MNATTDHWEPAELAAAPDPAPLERIGFAAGPDPMLVVDPFADRILAANQAAVRLIGAGAGAGRSFTALHPGQMPALLVFTEAVLTRGSWWTRALTPRLAGDGTARLEYAGTRIARPNGDFVLVTLVDLDARARRDTDTEAASYMEGGIAEWQRVARFFRDLERENQLILGAVGEGIYGVDAEGKTTFVNPAGARMLGWAAEDLVGKEMHATVHHHHPDGSHYDHRHCPIYAAFRDGAVHTVENEVFWHRDGRPIWVEYTSTPIRDRGEVVGAVVVFRDVSRRREAEERLKAALSEVEALRERLELENAYLKEEMRLEGNHRGIIGRSDQIQAVLRQIDLVAPTDASVLITGESGTGKELIARAIHEASDRAGGPLIRVNCAAIPRELFESEFFGHSKGAFTSALRDRIGRFELADGGTLFLDEVGEIPLDLQGKLLRVLQEGQFERVGDERTRAVDVRLIAATNRDLAAEVDAGRFRRDLYFRLNVFPIRSVPLRERPEDIPLLALHFLEQPGRKPRSGPATLTEGDVQRLLAYDWPGNVRELQNVIERGLILARNGRLRLDLPGGRRDAVAASPGPGAGDGGLITEGERRERDRAMLVAALKAAGGKVSGPDGAAARVGLKPTTFTSRLKALGLKPAEASGRVPTT